MNRKHEKKATETRALTAARSAGVPIPLGEIPGEEPDFTFNAGALGLEVSELLRPASSNDGIMPVAEEGYHQEILQMAEKEYYADPNAKPAKIILYFANARGKRRDTREMVRKLVEFVKANVHRAKPIANFGTLRLPEGFGSMSIAAESGDWWTGEEGNTTLTDIREALGSRISSKNKLVPTYRKNLAPSAQVWLLLYSTASISRGMPIPHGIDEWRLDFDFDRVFWFVCLGNEFVEIQRQNPRIRLQYEPRRSVPTLRGANWFSTLKFGCILRLLASQHPQRAALRQWAGLLAAFKFKMFRLRLCK